MALEKRHRIDPEHCLSLKTEANLVSSVLCLVVKEVLSQLIRALRALSETFCSESLSTGNKLRLTLEQSRGSFHEFFYLGQKIPRRSQKILDILTSQVVNLANWNPRGKDGFLSLIKKEQ